MKIIRYKRQLNALLRSIRSNLESKMKNKYRKYTTSYMKYLKFLHTEYKKPEFKKILCRGFFGFWDYKDWDYIKTKRESRMLGYYYDRILGIMSFFRNIKNDDSGIYQIF